MHLSDGEIRALLDRELDPERTAQVQAHLSTCHRCKKGKPTYVA
ncbi:MAG: zf-HC2 domain-containing protein [Anaerolineales bacterium]